MVPLEDTDAVLNMLKEFKNPEEREAWMTRYLDKVRKRGRDDHADALRKFYEMARDSGLF